jgi:hypothetical protein
MTRVIQHSIFTFCHPEVAMAAEGPPG